MSTIDGKSDQLQVQAGVTPGEQSPAALIISLDELQRLSGLKRRQIFCLSQVPCQKHIFYSD
jgi:hypothetical protein